MQVEEDTLRLEGDRQEEGQERRDGVGRSRKVSNENATRKDYFVW